MFDYLHHPLAPWLFAALFFLLYVRQTIRLRRRRLEAEFMRGTVFPIGAAVFVFLGLFLGRKMATVNAPAIPADE